MTEEQLRQRIRKVIEQTTDASSTDFCQRTNTLTINVEGRIMRSDKRIVQALCMVGQCDYYINHDRSF